MIQTVLKHGDIYVSQQGIAGRTALHLAAINGLMATTQLLVDHKAKIELRDKNGMTPLDHAIAHQHKTITQLLLD